MNRSVDKRIPNIDSEKAPNTERNSAFLTVLAMLAYSVLAFGNWLEQSVILMTVVAAPITYFLMMYLYYGIAKLAFRKQYLILGSGAMLAIILSCVIIESSRMSYAFTGWGVLLSAGIISGLMTQRGYRPRMVYVVSVIGLTIFVVLHYFSIWQDLSKSSVESIQKLLAEAESQLAIVGESKERTRLAIEMFQKLLVIIFRLIPAEIILSTAVQFSVGYILFVKWIDRYHLTTPRWEPFIYWQMPFVFIPVVMVFIVARLFGGEFIELTADNALVVLATFYSLTGMALLEYMLRKLRFSTLMKTLFYIMLFFLPLVSPTSGIIMGVGISLLGFIDSFADWRKVRLRELT